MDKKDSPDPLDQDIFAYQATKDGRVRISWHGRPVVVLRDKKAARFLQEIEGKDSRGQQLLMARVTGNFKRGNERG
jgi:hypothetical protein